MHDTASLQHSVCLILELEVHTVSLAIANCDLQDNPQYSLELEVVTW
jgi:hypothetical protein